MFQFIAFLMASVVSGWLTVLVNTVVEFGIHFLFYTISMSKTIPTKYFFTCGVVRICILLTKQLIAFSPMLPSRRRFEA